jgi:hypothetical protein
MPIPNLPTVKRLAIVAAVVVGLGLFGTGLRGVASVDGRLSDASDAPAVRGVDVSQKTRAPGGCPGREHRDALPPRDELSL